MKSPVQMCLKPSEVEDPKVIWDVDSEDFTEEGFFAQFRRELLSANDSGLISQEASRVKVFLDEWEKQLKSFDSEKFEKIGVSLGELFLETPKLSGVTYLSSNCVLSESFFDTTREGIRHLTDRSVSSIAQKTLPWSGELSFSFPRKYSFFGYANGWGFIRFPCKKGADILTSCTTLDSQIMSLLSKAGFSYIASLYNRVWEGTIHDYIHHIGLYTNPSFGIGSKSPMSKAQIDAKIEDWGRSMMSTFNYEYWAHQTHRLITEKTLSHQQQEVIEVRAIEYIREVYRFYSHLTRADMEQSVADDVIGYLLVIYLWPLSVLIHPESEFLKKIAVEIDKGPFEQKRIAVLEVADLLFEKGEVQNTELKKRLGSNRPNEKLEGLQSFICEATTGIDIGIAGTLRGLQIENCSEEDTLSWYDWLRVYTDTVARRGLYEHWYHKLPVFFDGQEIHPHGATLKSLEAVTETLTLFEQANL